MVNMIWVSNNLKVRAKVCYPVMPIFAIEMIFRNALVPRDRL